MNTQNVLKPGAIIRYTNGADYLYLKETLFQLLSRTPKQATSEDLVASKEGTPIEMAPWSIRCHSDFTLRLDPQALPEGVKVWSALDQTHLEDAQRLHAALVNGEDTRALPVKSGFTRSRDLAQALDLRAARVLHMEAIAQQLKAARLEGVKAFFDRCYAVFTDCSSRVLDLVEGELNLISMVPTGGYGTGSEVIRDWEEKGTHVFNEVEYDLTVQIHFERGRLRIRHRAMIKPEEKAQKLELPCKIFIYPEKEAEVIFERAVYLKFDIEISKQRMVIQDDIRDVIKQLGLDPTKIDIKILLP